MFELTSNITIKTTRGTIRFDHVADVVVNNTTGSLTGTCTVKVPRKIKWDGKDITGYARRGDQIKVQLGYDGRMHLVFDGYVASVKSTSPVEIHCEDMAWLLKKTTVTAKHYPSLELSSFLKEWMPAGITIECPMVNLGEVRVNQDVSLAMMLDHFMSKHSLRFFFREGVFYGALPSTMLLKTGKTARHVFRLGHNTAGQDLAYNMAEDVKITVVAKAVLKDNTLLEVQEPAGDKSGEVRTYICPWAKTKEELQVFAKEKLATIKIDGVTGSIDAFGEPLVQPGDEVKLLDDKNAEFNGKTFVASDVSRVFGTGGYRQKIELGMEVVS